MTKRDREQFFYDNAGFSYPTGTDQEQGHIDCAKKLAQAETWALENGYSFSIEPDPDADESWMDSEEKKEFAWYCQMLDDEGNVVQSLGGCYGGEKYKRVVRAELALEQMPHHQKDSECTVDPKKR